MGKIRRTPEDYLERLQYVAVQSAKLEKEISAKRLALEQRRHKATIPLINSYIERGSVKDDNGAYGTAWAMIQDGSKGIMARRSLKANLDYRDSLINLYEAMGSFGLAIEEAQGASEFVTKLAIKAEKGRKPRRIINRLYKKANDYKIIIRNLKDSAKNEGSRASESNGIDDLI